MLTFLKSIFRKTATEASAPILPVAQETASRMAKVETAALSLAAIIHRFPAELKSAVIQMPGDDATVALPVATIVKQLPTGSVKMSFASVCRQAPAGTFAPGRSEEKRMVEVPLSEVFKSVRADLLKPREGQRWHNLADEGIDLFGDRSNPYTVAPTISETVTAADLAPEAAPEPEPSPEAAPEPLTPWASDAPLIAPPTLRMDAPIAPPAPAPSAAPAEMKLAFNDAPLTPAEPPPAAPERASIPAPDLTASLRPPAASSAPALNSDQPPLVLPVADVAAAWPAEVLAELSADSGATIALPISEVTAGLAKGRVTFTWARVRNWITPPLGGETDVPGDLELVLPLRVLAPAFLKQSKQPRNRRESPLADPSIPELFNGGEAARPASRTLPEAESFASREIAPPAFTAATNDVADATPAAAHSANGTNGTNGTNGCSHPPEHAASTNSARTVGHIFGKPEKTEWSPVEIVDALVKLPEIAGAVVALQEGLVVAHRLPESMKGETIAAFLPQIFTRLNQYSNEMQLGDIEDVLFSTNGAYFQIFRLGFVFLAVLGKPGESLPWQELHIIAHELAQQTQH